MDAVIRQATKEDINAIWTFIDHAYGTGQEGTSQYKYPERWTWQFIDNPFVHEESNRLPIWLAIKNSCIVGQMCALPAYMRIGGQMYNGSWGCDLIVSEEFRGKGIGHKLTDIYYKHYQIGVGIAMALSTRRIWAKFNPVHLRPMYIYLYPVKLDKSIASYILGNKFVSHQDILAKLANVFFSLKSKINPMLNKRLKSKIHEIIGPFDELEYLSENTYKEYDTIVKRNSKYLNWRFFQNKEFKYKIFVSRIDGRIRGYVVLREPHPAELNLGHIVDFYAAKNDIDVINELILFAIKYFGRSVAAIKCSCSAIDIERLLLKYGFIMIQKMNPLALVPDSEIREKIKKSKDGWYLTLADQDLDQIVFNRIGQ